MSRRIDRAFARFRDHGDPLALAQVFDATAEQLYRLAWHLTCDRHAAEDLVQATFLTAIEDARAHAPERAILPWLCGVLTNRARMRWRRQRVERAAVQELAVAEVGAGDPVETAALRELSEAARARLRALPEPYRQVCLLHLEQGLGSHEIAAALARPDATVRSQLQRGLDMLRRALPLALGAASRAAMPAPALAVVRARVLAHVPQPAALTTSTVGGGVAGLVWLAVAVVALAVGLWLWSAPAELDARADEAGVATVASTPAPGTLDAAAAAEPTRRESVAAAETVDPAAELAVHVTWESDHAPAAGVVVRFVPARADAELREREARTDALGVARFAAPLPGLALVCPDRGGQAEVEVRRQGQTTVTVQVPAGTTVQGVVRDGRGQPCCGASVWLSSVNRDLLHGSVVATTGGDGAFTLRDVTPGRLLSVWSAEAAPAAVQSVPATEAGSWSTSLWLVEPGSGSVRGKVVDERGLALVGAKLVLGTSIGALSPWGDVPRVPPARTATSDRHGLFEFVGVAPEAEATVWLRACAPGRALAQVPLVVDGPTVAHVVLPIEAQLTGVARDRDGDPAWRGEVAVGVPELLHVRGGLPRWAQLAANPGRDGRFTVGSIPAGRFPVRAAEGVDIANAEFEFRAGEACTWDAALRERAIVGEVVDEQGRPCAGVTVAAENEAVPAVAPTQTGRDGRFRLDGLDVAPYELVVGNDPVDGLVRVPGVLPGDSRPRVTLPAAFLPSARLGARVELPAPSAGVEVTMRRVRADGSWTWVEARCQGEHFLSPRVRAGRYHLRFSIEGWGARDCGFVELGQDQQVELPPVRFAKPGSLLVRVAVAPDTFPCRFVFVHSAATSSLDSGERLEVEGDVAELGALQPGGYWVTTSHGATFAGVRVEVRAGERSEGVLAVPRGRLCQLLLPQGTSPSTAWQWRDREGALVARLTGFDPADLTGGFTALIAPGPYTIDVSDPRGATGTAQVAVEPDATGVTIPLPAPSSRR